MIIMIFVDFGIVFRQEMSLKHPYFINKWVRPQGHLAWRSKPRKMSLGVKNPEKIIFGKSCFLGVKSSGEHPATVFRSIRRRERVEKVIFSTFDFFFSSKHCAFQKVCHRDRPLSRNTFFKGRQPWWTHISKCANWVQLIISKLILRIDTNNMKA